MPITNVMAISLDGKIASHPGERDIERRKLGFTNDDDRQHLLGLLGKADAVIVGSSSLKASGGAFSGLNDRGRYPTWVVLSNQGLPPSERFYQQKELPRWLVSKASLTLPPHCGAVLNLVYGEESPAQVVARALKAAGAERILLFGGASVNQEFYAQGLVDHLIVTVCPLIIAQSAAVPLVAPGLIDPVRMKLVASQQLGNLVILSYDLIKRATHGLTRSD